MPSITVTGAAWSDAVTLTQNSILQAEGDVAVFIGSGTPPANERGTILEGGQSERLNSGAVFRVRAASPSRGAVLHYQDWPG